VSGAPTPKLLGYACVAGAGLLSALALGRPELAVLATPFALVTGLGLALARRPRLALTVEPPRKRALQGETLDVDVRIESDVPLEALELVTDLPAGLSVDERAVALRLPPRRARSHRLAIRCERWGGYQPGRILARTRDPLGLFTYEDGVPLPATLRVYPLEETLRSVVRPAATQTFSGNEVARLKGDGIEFADVRPFVPGDEARDEAAGTLDLAVRAASSLASRYLARNDRVGLVSFGGILRWLVPSMGRTQVFRIVDALLDTEIAFSYAWKGVDVIPPRTLPPQALVIALTPLLDERTAAALLDLRSRGFDLAIVDVSPLPFVGPGATEAEHLARRLWALQREVLRHRYRELGVAVAEWGSEGSLQGALEEVTAFRRAARVVRA
jgi:uncharacterized protein (DUF58 family)